MYRNKYLNKLIFSGFFSVALSSVTFCVSASSLAPDEKEVEYSSHNTPCVGKPVDKTDALNSDLFLWWENQRNIQHALQITKKDSRQTYHLMEELGVFNKEKHRIFAFLEIEKLILYLAHFGAQEEKIVNLIKKYSLHEKSGEVGDIVSLLAVLSDAKKDAEKRLKLMSDYNLFDNFSGGIEAAHMINVLNKAGDEDQKILEGMTEYGLLAKQPMRSGWSYSHRAQYFLKFFQYFQQGCLQTSDKLPLMKKYGFLEKIEYLGNIWEIVDLLDTKIKDDSEDILRLIQSFDPDNRLMINDIPSIMTALHEAGDNRTKILDSIKQSELFDYEMPIPPYLELNEELEAEEDFDIKEFLGSPGIGDLHLLIEALHKVGSERDEILLLMKDHHLFEFCRSMNIGPNYKSYEYGVSSVITALGELGEEKEKILDYVIKSPFFRRLPDVRELNNSLSMAKKVIFPKKTLTSEHIDIYGTSFPMFLTVPEYKEKAYLLLKDAMSSDKYKSSSDAEKKTTGFNTFSPTPENFNYISSNPHFLHNLLQVISRTLGINDPYVQDLLKIAVKNKAKGITMNILQENNLTFL